MKTKYYKFGFILGLVASGVVIWLGIDAPPIRWVLAISFPVCWAIAGAIADKGGIL